MKKTVVELFAGVGGFRVGLNQVTDVDENGRAIEIKNFDFVWANQWEPSSNPQHAFLCYIKRFGDSEKHVNSNICSIDTSKIPYHTLLVGGFPCQDYSVARTKSGEKGIEGKKGVLWWEIIRILKDKKTPFILLENVDRLLRSPSKQRGRDFSIMLKTLSNLGYGVEWRVINAADYGYPQKRKRVFIFAFHKSTIYYKKYKNINNNKLLDLNGFFAKVFPVEKIDNFIHFNDFLNENDLVKISDNFSFNFLTSGCYISGKLLTAKTRSIKENGTALKDILLDSVDEKYFLTEQQIEKFKILKNSKSIKRISSNGYTYNYTEGKMSFPDNIDIPGRTMLTSEGSINRSTHVITDLNTGKLRFLTPIECERLNQFPDNWTNTDMPEKKRYFMMGNALVCGLITKMGYEISDILSKEK